MIKYLGSKRLLLERIGAAIRAVAGPRATVFDPFSGTARVGRDLKRAGHRVFASDHNAYAAVLARAHVAADRDRWHDAAIRLVAELNSLPGAPGYVTETFCERARYFQPHNGARIDAIRDRIATLALEPELEAIALASLIEAADRVDSTTGVQMAYLKRWAPRSHHPLELRVPDLLPRPAGGPCEARQLDAFEAADRIDADVAYLDPPYNQHSYLGNYHVWETIVRWDAPEVYGVACKRVDCRERKSAFNAKRQCAAALAELIERVRAPRLVISFSDEGYVARAEMEAMLAGARGGGLRFAVAAHDYKRYVGAQIGIHNPRGERVGRVSHLRNTEYLYVAVPAAEEARLAAVRRLGEGCRAEGSAGPVANDPVARA